MSNSTETAYQDYSVSIDSFSSAKSPSPFSINTSSHYYNNQNNDFEGNYTKILFKNEPNNNLITNFRPWKHNTYPNCAGKQ